MKNEEVTLILAGGNLSLPFLENVIKEHAGATIIAADRGLEACMKLQIEPDYVIGCLSGRPSQCNKTQSHKG